MKEIWTPADFLALVDELLAHQPVEAADAVVVDLFTREVIA